MATSNRGLGSSNMDDKTKHEIQSKGGRASHGSSSSSNNGGATNSKEAQRKGGQNSHRS